LPISGKDIGVVVNDSGVDGTHNDIKLGRNLVQNVFASSNLNALTGILPITYVENVPNTDSDSGHGTHVAGTVGGTGAMSGGKYEGVAPGAKLIGYGSGAVVAMLDTIGGFDYALTHQQEYNIRIITNSWGSTSDAGTDFDPFDPINIATKKLYDRGIITVFSAGNSGPGEATISGNYKKAPWVITVAAGTKDGELADFSSRGVKDNGGEVEVDGTTFVWEDSPTITAPGVDIISTRVLSPLSALSAQKDVEYIDPAHLPYYTTFSGTSMAAPHVAGIIALLLEVNPTLDSFDIKEILQTSATNMEDYEKWEVGSGYVNAYEAVKLAGTY
jgi:subtilisin family serine protease